MKKRLRCKAVQITSVQALSDCDKGIQEYWVKCLTKWKTKMITRIKLCLVIRLLFI